MSGAIFTRASFDDLEKAGWDIVARYDILAKFLGTTAEAGPYMVLGNFAVGLIICYAADHDRLPDSIFTKALWAGTGVESAINDYIEKHPDAVREEESSPTPTPNPFPSSAGAPPTMS
ncbi:MAG: hypothetical protein ACYDC0_16755 [Acidimicrobiales bacterium]